MAKKSVDTIDSISEEKRKCREAWRGKGFVLGHLVHHDGHYELVGWPAGRIKYIAEHKPLEEKAARYHYFRPVEGSRRAWHRKNFPNCPWGRKEFLDFTRFYSGELSFSKVLERSKLCRKRKK